MKRILILLICLAATAAGAQKFTGLALTPPMGWNSWNKFRDAADEAIIRAMADAMATNGMKAAGYQYINIDDCWQGTRDAQGFIRPDPVKFPSGLQALADYVHARGLKLGIYSDAGFLTCGGRPASRGREFQDAQTYAQWGVDYLKYDWCGCGDLQAEGAYRTMRDALYAAGRPVVFSVCEWGQNQPWRWAGNVGQLWRTTTDIYPGFDGTVNYTNWHAWGVLQILDAQKPLRAAAGPGHWNDPDMLEVGNGKLSLAENRSHFSMWAMLAAPLLAGNDLPHMKPEIKDILTNRDVIAIDQDPLGKQGSRVYSDGEVEVWTRPLANGALAIAVLNAGDNRYSTHPFHLNLAKLGLHGTQTGKDLWSGKTMKLTGNMPVELGSHDILLVRIDAPK